MNKARCKNCGNLLHSKHRHDFVSCSCFKDIKGHGIFIDGGDDYCRRGGNMNDFEYVKAEVV